MDKIETPPENLEQNVASTPIKQEDANKTTMTYAPDEDYATGQAQKYQTETASVSLKRIETHQELQKVELRNQFEIPRRDEWRSWEKPMGAETIEQTNNLPFEKEDKKYKEFKPHLED